MNLTPNCPLLTHTRIHTHTGDARRAMDDGVETALERLSLAEQSDQPTTPKRTCEGVAPVTPEHNRRATPSSAPKTPSALPPPFVTHPVPGEHAATLVMLHGFTNTGKRYGGGWVPTLRQLLGAGKLGSLKIVWLNAPVRAVSCYGDERPRLPAWHDYFTDHGGEEGRPELEEEIDVEHLKWSREMIHAVLDAEAAALGGDFGRVAIGGQSQGGCMAIDVALTHPRGGELAGCFLSFGQLYSATPVPTDRAALRVVAFHGAADRIISVGLAMRSYAKLADAGMRHMRVNVEPGLGHSEPSDAESAVLTSALRDWGLMDMVPVAAQARRPTESSSAATVLAGGPQGVMHVEATVAATPSPGPSASRRRRSSGRQGKGGGPAGDTREGLGSDGGGADGGGVDEELEIAAAWYGDSENLWAMGEGEGKDVTAAVRRMVLRGELRLNERREGGWYNQRFSDTAPGTWKVMAVKYRYGDGALRQVVSPCKENEKASLVITPSRSQPKSTPLKAARRDE